MVITRARASFSLALLRFSRALLLTSKLARENRSCPRPTKPRSCFLPRAFASGREGIFQGLKGDNCHSGVIAGWIIGTIGSLLPAGNGSLIELCWNGYSVFFF